jgi:hypothetical protein
MRVHPPHEEGNNLAQKLVKKTRNYRFVAQKVANIEEMPIRIVRVMAYFLWQFGTKYVSFCAVS